MAKPHHQSQVSAAKSLFCQVRVQFTLQIEQIQGGPNDGMFVAHDAVAKLTGMQLKNAGPKIKNIASSMEGEFKSLTIIPSGHANVCLVNFCTTNTNLY